MKKDLGIKPYLFPMPVVMIATYNEDGSTNVMNMAWGSICGYEYVSLNIDDDHKTAENIRRNKAFTLSLATVKTMKESDYFGIDSGAKVHDKFARTGWHSHPSSKVNAPIIEEYPLSIECEFVGIEEHEFCNRYLGHIKGCLVDEEMLDEKGQLDFEKMEVIAYDPAKNHYFLVKDIVGQAFRDGLVFRSK